MESIKSIDKNGTVRYRNESGKLHREDGPAIESPDGTKLWKINGLRHREDGPAYEKPDSFKEWYINNKRHREDGPARIWENGDSEYWLNDLKYSKDEWEEEIIKIKLKRIKDL